MTTPTLYNANTLQYGNIYRNAMSCQIKLCCSVTQESAMILSLF